MTYDLSDYAMEVIKHVCYLCNLLVIYNLDTPVNNMLWVYSVLYV